jgi:hypothetical protein
MNAICLHCGSTKKAGWEKCGVCSFDPNCDETSLVRSVYLSVDRFESAEDRAAYCDELAEMSSRITQGERIEFDEAEIDRLRQQLSLIQAVSTSDVCDVLWRLFLPGLLLILSLIALRFLLKVL